MRRWGIGLSVVLVACGSEAGPGQGWDPSDESGAMGTGQAVEDDDMDGSTSGVGTGGATGNPTDATDPTVAETDGDSDSDDETSGGSTTGEEPVDCTPAWATPWIGSPCMSNADCSFAGGTCLQEDDGFPCGTCSQSCTTVCPDVDDTPVTYCINGTDVGLADAGYCLSKCDSFLLGGDGCRDGYVCDVLWRYDETGNDGVCIPDEFNAIDPGEDELVDEIDHEFLIDHLGGVVANPFDYGPDLDSFQQYLNAVGVQHTSAQEIAEPYNQAAATGCGYSILLPERDEWEKAAALALFTDDLTELVGEPIFMRNWWRPPCYNSAVGGAAGGDHPTADAVDLDFSSNASRAIAQGYLCEMYWSQDIVEPDQIAPGSNLDPRLNMSVGLGGLTIHLGVLSAGGRRSWFYGSYTNEPGSGDCW